MMPATQQTKRDRDVLERLNRLSLTRSFTPQVDIDWSATTTDAEYESLYSCWSLLEGTGVDAHLDAPARAMFVKYQQMNLMAFTGLLERHALASLAQLYDLDPAQAFSEYVGHFIKEETYHYTMFMQAVQQIQSGIPGAQPLPTREVDRALRGLFRLLSSIPSKKLRSTLTFTIFRFAEQVTLEAHQMVQSHIPRRESLINQVWAFHALDESRHVAFDQMILERSRLWRPLAWVPRVMAAPCCLMLSLLLNANEVWIARQLGVNVRWWHLLGLMRRTRAPFKRRIFRLMARTLLGQDTTPE
jgi:hypothetical protein